MTMEQHREEARRSKGIGRNRAKTRLRAGTWKFGLFVLATMVTLAFWTGCPDKPTHQYHDGGLDAGGDSQIPSVSIVAVEPSIGPMSGGTHVTITGSGFEDGMTVTFGATPASGVTVLDSEHAACTTPPASEAGRVTVRVELSGGRTAQLVGGFEYIEEQVNRITWCILQYPPATTTEPSVPTEPIYGRVFAQGITDAPGQGLGIDAEVGYGPPGTDPTTDDNWHWVPATYNVDPDEANDEYMGSLTVDQEGTYAYAFRFGMNGQWTYCDRDGTDNGFSTDQEGSLTVQTGEPETVDWCGLQGPLTLDVILGRTSDAVYGQVYEPGVTPGSGQGSGISAQAGFGPEGSDPSAAPQGWAWVDADYNAAGPQGNNDEYMATFQPTQTGTFSFVYRFSLNGGPWTYCDSDGGTFEPGKAGTMTVTSDATELVDWCNLQWPYAITVSAGRETEAIYGRVYKDGVTPGAGQGAGILAQVGYGPDGSDPSADASNWTWVDATYNVDVDGLTPGDLANDEYQATLTVQQAGTFDYAYRFSADNGNTWLYCDQDGSDNGYSPDQAGDMTVQ